MPPRQEIPSPLSINDDYDMLDLEPTPMIDSPPPPSSPSTVPPPQFSLNPIPAFANSHIPHGSTVIRWLTRAQKYSSYAFTSFLGLHFTTTGLIPLVSGSEAADNSLTLARVFYQTNPFLEAALIPGSLLIHTLSGLSLRIYRYKQQKKRYGKAPASFFAPSNFSRTSITGYVLLPLVTAHAVLTRVVPLYLDGDSSEIGLGFVAHGFDYHGRIGWWLSSLYYVGFIGITTSHVVHGMAKWWKVRSIHRARLNMAILALAGVWLGSLWAVVSSARRNAGGYLASKYDYFYHVFFRVLRFRF